MAGHWTDIFSYITGSIRMPDLGYFVIVADEAAEMKIPSADIIEWDPEGWGNGGQMPWRAAGSAIAPAPLEQFCVVGEFGGVLLLGSGDRHEEQVAQGPRSAKDRGPLRGVRTVGKHVYCVGMGRQAWRREDNDVWVPIDGSIPFDPEGEVVGFEAVDGFSEKDIYAAGWDGEIWHFDGNAWASCDSPVNTVLVDVCCAEDGQVYACGRNGVLVRGRGAQWEVVDLKGFTDDLWSLVSFGKRLYLATTEYVFTLGPDGLELVDMGPDKPATCYDLTTGAGLLWSIGAKDVMSFDGKSWSRID
jgi:hypothetical protein